MVTKYSTWVNVLSSNPDHCWLTKPYLAERLSSGVLLVSYTGSCRQSEPSGLAALPGSGHTWRILSALLAAEDPACPLQSGTSSAVLLCVQEARPGREKLLRLRKTKQDRLRFCLVHTSCGVDTSDCADLQLPKYSHPYGHFVFCHVVLAVHVIL